MSVTDDPVRAAPHRQHPSTAVDDHAEATPGPSSAAASRGSRLVRTAAAVLVGALVGTSVAAAGYGISERDHADPALGPGVVTVEVGIQHSRFDLGELRVREGTLVQFVVHNGDPIDHELVVGDAEVHRRHANGGERRHPPVPGELSVAPGATAMTFYEFGEPGTVVYACHLPGHEAYGMTGTIEVMPAS